ncbi:unnamed protein product [Amoebophrya sp. A25]|nr:unnamed protein product [Amoebophrya sp. A25]|eukprot:GSA25T00010322001.1
MDGVMRYLMQNPGALRFRRRGLDSADEDSDAEDVATNDAMVDHLLKEKTLKTSAIADAFRSIDRKVFVPEVEQGSAYSIVPLRDGLIHISAPDMYAKVLEQLWPLEPGMNFLNIGSGTGYFNCIVAKMIDPRNEALMANHGIDIWTSTINYAEERVSKVGMSSQIRFFKSNIYHLDTGSSAKYHRIYLGSCAPASLKAKIYDLLEIGGVLVGPWSLKRGHQVLRKVVRKSQREFDTTDIEPVQFTTLVEPQAQTAVTGMQVSVGGLQRGSPRPGLSGGGDLGAPTRSEGRDRATEPAESATAPGGQQSRRILVASQSRQEDDGENSASGPRAISSTGAARGSTSSNIQEQNYESASRAARGRFEDAPAFGINIEPIVERIEDHETDDDDIDVIVASISEQQRQARNMTFSVDNTGGSSGTGEREDEDREVVEAVEEAPREQDATEEQHLVKNDEAPSVLDIRSASKASSAASSAPGGVVSSSSCSSSCSSAGDSYLHIEEVEPPTIMAVTRSRTKKDDGEDDLMEQGQPGQQENAVVEDDAMNLNNGMLLDEGAVDIFLDDERQKAVPAGVGFSANAAVACEGEAVGGPTCIEAVEDADFVNGNDKKSILEKDTVADATWETKTRPEIEEQQPTSIPVTPAALASLDRVGTLPVGVGIPKDEEDDEVASAVSSLAHSFMSIPEEASASTPHIFGDRRPSSTSILGDEEHVDGAEIATENILQQLNGGRDEVQQATNTNVLNGPCSRVVWSCVVNIATDEQMTESAVLEQSSQVGCEGSERTPSQEGFSLASTSLPSTQHTFSTQTQDSVDMALVMPRPASPRVSWSNSTTPHIDGGLQRQPLARTDAAAAPASASTLVSRSDATSAAGSSTSTAFSGGNGTRGTTLPPEAASDVGQLTAATSTSLVRSDSATEGVIGQLADSPPPGVDETMLQEVIDDYQIGRMVRHEYQLHLLSQLGQAVLSSTQGNGTSRGHELGNTVTDGIRRAGQEQQEEQQQRRGPAQNNEPRLRPQADPELSDMPAFALGSQESETTAGRQAPSALPAPRGVRRTRERDAHDGTSPSERRRRIDPEQQLPVPSIPPLPVTPAVEDPVSSVPSWLHMVSAADMIRGTDPVAQDTSDMAGSIDDYAYQPLPSGTASSSAAASEVEETAGNVVGVNYRNRAADGIEAANDMVVASDEQAERVVISVAAREQVGNQQVQGGTSIFDVEQQEPEDVSEDRMINTAASTDNTRGGRAHSAAMQQRLTRVQEGTARISQLMQRRRLTQRVYRNHRMATFFRRQYLNQRVAHLRSRGGDSGSGYVPGPALRREREGSSSGIAQEQELQEVDGDAEESNMRREGQEVEQQQLSTLPVPSGPVLVSTTSATSNSMHNFSIPPPPMPRNSSDRTHSVTETGHRGPTTASGTTGAGTTFGEQERQQANSAATSDEEEAQRRFLARRRWRSFMRPRPRVNNTPFRGLRDGEEEEEEENASPITGDRRTAGTTGTTGGAGGSGGGSSSSTSANAPSTSGRNKKDGKDKKVQMPRTYQLPDAVWRKESHKWYPENYKEMVRTLLLSSQRPGCAIPTDLWVSHVLPFCRRHWFDVTDDEESRSSSFTKAKSDGENRGTESGGSCGNERIQNVIEAIAGEDVTMEDASRTTSGALDSETRTSRPPPRNVVEEHIDSGGALTPPPLLRASSPAVMIESSGGRAPRVLISPSTEQTPVAAFARNRGDIRTPGSSPTATSSTPAGGSFLRDFLGSNAAGAGINNDHTTTSGGATTLFTGTTSTGRSTTEGATTTTTSTEMDHVSLSRLQQPQRPLQGPTSTGASASPFNVSPGENLMGTSLRSPGGRNRTSVGRTSNSSATARQEPVVTITGGFGITGAVSRLSPPVSVSRFAPPLSLSGSRTSSFAEDEEQIGVAQPEPGSRATGTSEEVPSRSVVPDAGDEPGAGLLSDSTSARAPLSRSPQRTREEVEGAMATALRDAARRAVNSNADVASSPQQGSTTSNSNFISEPGGVTSGSARASARISPPIRDPRRRNLMSQTQSRGPSSHTGTTTSRTRTNASRTRNQNQINQSQNPSGFYETMAGSGVRHELGAGDDPDDVEGEDSGTELPVDILQWIAAAAAQAGGIRAAEENNAGGIGNANAGLGGANRGGATTGAGAGTNRGGTTTGSGGRGGGATTGENTTTGGNANDTASTFSSTNVDTSSSSAGAGPPDVSRSGSVGPNAGAGSIAAAAGDSPPGSMPPHHGDVRPLQTSSDTTTTNTRTSAAVNVETNSAVETTNSMMEDTSGNQAVLTSNTGTSSTISGTAAPSTSATAPSTGTSAGVGANSTGASQAAANASTSNSRTPGSTTPTNTSAAMSSLFASQPFFNSRPGSINIMNPMSPVMPMLWTGAATQQHQILRTMEVAQQQQQQSSSASAVVENQVAQQEQGGNNGSAAPDSDMRVNNTSSSSPAIGDVLVNSAPALEGEVQSQYQQQQQPPTSSVEQDAAGGQAEQQAEDQQEETTSTVENSSTNSLSVARPVFRSSLSGGGLLRMNMNNAPQSQRRSATTTSPLLYNNFIGFGGGPSVGLLSSNILNGQAGLGSTGGANAGSTIGISNSTLRTTWPLAPGYVQRPGFASSPPPNQDGE